MNLVRFTSNVLRSPTSFFRYLRYATAEYNNNELLRLSGIVGTDKGLPGHGYVRIYDTFLKERRDSVTQVCEIGLLHIRQQALDGRTYRFAPSLEMWAHYFPNAHVLGFDLEKFSPPTNERCTIIQGDQSSREDLQKIINGETQFDVIIDDALHASRHQQITLAYLFPHLTSGGLFFIEDLHWQPNEFETPEIPKTLDLIREFLATGKWNSPLSTPEERSILENTIETIYLFDSMKGNIRNGQDAIAVIVKK